MAAQESSRIRIILHSFWQKRWLRFLVYISSLLLVFLLILPHAVRIGLERWLLNNGADEATINKIEINLFTGAASLKGVNVTLKGRTVLANSDIFINFGINALFKHHTLIQSASLHNVILDIEQYEDGRWRYGSYTVQPGREAEKMADEAEESWIFGAGQIELSDCLIRYTQPKLEISLFIQEGQLVKFTTAPTDKSGTLTLKGLLNNAPYQLNLDTLRIAPELDIGGKINTSGLRLDDLAEFLKEYLNPFIGIAAAEGEFKFTLAQDTSILVDYAGKIELDEGNIGGPGYAVEGKNVSWRGPVNYRQGNSRITITVDGQLQAADFMLNLPEQKLQLLEESLEFKSQTSVNIDQQVTVNSEGKINLVGTEFAMPPYQVQNKNLSWEGTSFYSSLGHHVKVDGSLDLEEPSFAMADEKTRTDVVSKIISWQGVVEYLGDEPSKTVNTLSLKGALHNSELGVTLPDPALEYFHDELILDTNLTVPLDDPRSVMGDIGLQAEGLQLKDTTTEQQLMALGHFVVENLHAPQGQSLEVGRTMAEELELTNPANAALTITIPEITLDKFITEDMKNFSVQTLAVKSLQAMNTEQQKQLVSIEAILLTDIEADDSFNFAAETLVVNNTQFFEHTINEKKGNFLQLDRLSVNKPEWRDGKKLNIEDIKLEDAQVSLLRDTNGKLLLLQELQELKGEPSKEQPAESEEIKEKKESPVFTFQIGEISVTGDSSFTFQDHSLKIPFIANLAVETLRFTDIDSGQPDKAASYELTGNLDKYASVNLKGTVKPFGEEYSLLLTGSVHDYPIVRLSPYSIKYLGFVPTQGTVSVDTKLSIDKDHIDLQKTWLLKKLEIKTVDEKLAGEFNSQLPLPLNSALNMLKDKHDNIELSIPISGTKDDLNFGITDIFITPLSKAIVSASSSYLLYALGPYGAAAFVGMKVGEKMMETRVPPVEFEPGKNELTDEHKKYLERIAEILKDRPKIDLQLCAWVLPAEHITDESKKEQAAQPNEDIAADKKEVEEAPPAELSDDDKKALLILGNSRAVAIKDYLVRNHDIDPGRLLICLPELEKSKDGKPRVDLKV